MNSAGRIILVVVLVLLALPLLGGGMMMGGFGPHGPGMMWGWESWRSEWTMGRLLVGMLPLVAVLLIVGLLIALVLGGSSRQSGALPTRPTRETPREILDARYAQGELTREQYHQMREDLDT